MRFSFLACIATSVAIAFATACSPPRDERVGTTSQAIQGGTVDMTHRYAVGVQIGGGGICTGALIAPNVVVTARHCIDNTQATIDCTANPIFGSRKGGGFTITTHHDMFNAPGSTRFNVQSLAVPPDNHVCGNDIALLVLQTMVPAAQATPIIPGVQYPMNLSSYLAQFTAIGYGNTSPGGGGSGIRRMRTAIPILCIPGDKKRPCPADFNAREFIAGDGTCSGDSGSGAFEQNSYVNGLPVNFGVLSRGGQSDDGTLCQGSVYTRLDQFRDFVINTVRSASSNWTLYPEPTWTTYVPPPVEPPRPDAGPGTPLLPLGEICVNNEDCVSGACIDPGTGTFVCTQACSSQGLDCPEGFECQGDLCFAPGGPAGSSGKTTRTTEGCGLSASENPDAPFTYAAVLAGFLAISASRRRKKP